MEKERLLTPSELGRRKRDEAIIAEFVAIMRQSPETAVGRVYQLIAEKHLISPVTVHRVLKAHKEKPQHGDN